jgi:hypothetical protein
MALFADLNAFAPAVATCPVSSGSPS